MLILEGGAMSTVDIIIEAVEKHRTLSFDYHGHERIVSPYCVGLTTTNEIKMLAYQTAGGSTSGVCPKLRYFTVEDMIGTDFSEAFFEPADESATAQYASFSRLYAKL